MMSSNNGTTILSAIGNTPLVELKRVNPNPKVRIMAKLEGNNPANPQAHYETTGPEIWQQTDGEIDVFVTGLGTTGTLMGISRYMKERPKPVKVIGVEPVQGHTIQGLKNMTESIVPEIYQRPQLDEVLDMGDEEAFDMTRRLATEEGLFAGISSGANLAGAVRLAKDMDSGTIVTIICDRGDRYLSTMLFRSVCAKCPP